MKFISVEQFLKATGKVRESVLTWWEPSLGDLVECTNKDEVYCLSNDQQVTRAEGAREKSLIIPLLTTQQLIDYIEWRTEYAINKIEFGVADCYWVEPYYESTYSMDEVYPRWWHDENSFCHEELIQVLWKCACEVADDPYYDK
ncbi:MAG: hypothetical protein ACRCX8_10385 [Sarcina sp.]